MTSKYRYSITATYDFDEDRELMQEYLEWLDDHTDSEIMRRCFLRDRFATPDIMLQIDRKARVVKLEVQND